MRTKREKMSSTPVQFTDKQYLNSEVDYAKEKVLSIFQSIYEKPVDFYTEQKYPHLAK